MSRRSTWENTTVEDRLDTPVAGNREQRRAAQRTKKVAALGSGMVLVAAGASTALTLASSAPAGANTTIVVSTTADTGAGSLRQAIIDANAAGGQDTITFSVTGTITLASDLPLVTDALKIQGPGSAALTIDGANNAIFNFYKIDSAAGVDEVSGLTITHGTANNFDDSGGGIVVRLGSADMTIANDVITDNYAGNDGGGVQFYDNTGHMTVSGTTISNNTAFYGGGGLYADGDGNGPDSGLVVMIENSTITGNTAGANGGGLYLSSVDATVTNSTINFNQAKGDTKQGEGYGGGIFAHRSVLTLSSSFVGNNTSYVEGGGILGYGTDTTIEFSTITGNQAVHDGGGGGGGGAKFYDDGGTSTFTMRNSTVSNNTAQYYGGGLYLRLGGASVIENSTISGNTGNQAGGVYGSAGGLTLNQVTVTNTTAADPSNGEAVGGIQATGVSALPAGVEAHRAAQAAHATGAHEGKNKHGANESAKKDRVRGSGVHAAASDEELDVIGTIVSGNAGVNIGSNHKVLTVSSNHSLLGATGLGVTVTDVGGSLLGVNDPGLLPLADNGGPTQTHALAVGSPAKDAGPNPLTPFTGSDFDQRGAGFDRVVDGVVDIGAFEVQAPPPIEIAPKFTG